MGKLKSILVLPNSKHCECVDPAKALEASLRSAGFDVSSDRGAIDSVDLVVLLGGDGYLMESIHDLEYPGVCFFGVNFGNVGFLMNPRSCLDELPATLLEDRFQVEDYPVLESTVELADGSTSVQFAFNDMVLDRLSGQSIRFEMRVDGAFFNHYSGDGMIVATPGGSTAYNLAAGGPVVHPGVEAMLVTPLYPHRAEPFHSLEFPILLPLTSTLTIEGHDVSKRPVQLLADGRPLENVAGMSVRDSGKRIRLLRLSTHRFTETLSRKFIGEGK